MSFLPTCLLAIHKLVETQLRYEVSMPGCSCSLILQCAKVIPDAMQWVRRQCKAATMKSAFFFFFGFVAVLQCNVMPTRILSLHMRFCFLLQRSCFAWFAFWRANRLKELVCLFFTSANCQLLWNGEERREPSISISALVVFGNSLRLVALRIDMSSHLWLWLKKYKKKRTAVMF